MKSFSAFRHVGGEEIRFVGDCWEDGGLTVGDDGSPTHDERGNTIGKFAVTEIDERDADLLAAAYCGDEIPDRAGFVDWMAAEEIPAQIAKIVADTASKQS